MSKKILTIQDISCYGQCSTTVALPILSAYGIETAILPSAILSTHTSGFKNFTVLDLTDEMPKIINHWKQENIKFDALYTGYIGDERQFDLILECKKNLLNKNAIFFVDPAMADHGKLYPALNEEIILGMKKISKLADYIIPNVTEAAFLTDTKYEEIYSEEFINLLLYRLKELGAKKIFLTGVCKENKLGVIYYDGKNKIECYKDLIFPSYHGTGDIFSSLILSGILNNEPIDVLLDKSTQFIVESIKNTLDDNTHSYGVKFEEILKKGIIA